LTDGTSSVLDAGRLMDARTRLQANDALPFVFELDPALQHVDELKLGAVQMRLAGKRRTARRPDHMRGHAPLRRAFDAQIAVLEERTQPAFEHGVFCVGGDKTLGGHGGSWVIRELVRRPNTD
jgi:hypothetical protein